MVVAATRADAAQAQQIDSLVGPARERQLNRKSLATRRIVQSVLSNHSLPDHYKFHLFILEPETQQLVPSFTADDSDAENWPVGVGATGEAWRREAYVVQRNEQITQDLGVEGDRALRYEHLAVVASMPVLDDQDQILAVLTGSGTTDDGRLLSEDGFDRHKESAVVTARVLVDVLEMDSL